MPEEALKSGIDTIIVGNPVYNVLFCSNRLIDRNITIDRLRLELIHTVGLVWFGNGEKDIIHASIQTK